MATARLRGKSYEIRVFCGLDEKGKRLYKYTHWTPDTNMTPKQIEKEVERQKILFENRVKKGEAVDGNVRFRDFAQRWMTEYAKPKLAPKTIARYKGLLTRINIAIGHLKLSDIRPMHLNAFYKNLAEPGVCKRNRYDEEGNVIHMGLSPKSILEHHRLISKILNTAVRWELINNNAARRADPPSVPYQERKCLDVEEVKRMLFLLHGEPVQYRVMITLLVYTGMRRGELCGLEWKDIDFEHSTLTISRSSQYIGNKQLITKDPKTKAGIRKLSMSATISTLLSDYQRWQEKEKEKVGDQWIETGRLFTQWNGKPIYPDTLTAWFPDFLKRHGLPKVTLHSLRHSNATLMIAEGTDIRTVSNRLGHAQTSTTLNIYTHALKSRDQEAAKMLDMALNF